MSLFPRTWTASGRQCSPHSPLVQYIRPLVSSRGVHRVNVGKLSLWSSKQSHLSPGVELEERQKSIDTRVKEIEDKSVRVWPGLAVGLGLTALVCSFGLFAPSAAMASAGEKLAASFQGKLPDWLVVLCISAFPIVELRGAIPVRY